MSAIRAYLRPTGHHSRAMQRVADAVTRYRPSSVEIAGSPSNYCDFQLLHVISHDARDYAANLRARGIKYAVIQYCGGESLPRYPWYDMWKGAEVVWSYYDLTRDAMIADFNFYHAPLGIDDVFLKPKLGHGNSLPPIRHTILTSGYSSGPHAEAIKEVWCAANLANMNIVHLGPRVVEGISSIVGRYVVFEHNVKDDRLAFLYQSALWVSGLRHVEGFEMPAIEGLALGARPLLFDQRSQRHWYGDYAEYVPELTGDDLTLAILSKISQAPRPVALSEREEIIAKFNWQTICAGFWQRVLNSLDERVLSSLGGAQ